MEMMQATATASYPVTIPRYLSRFDLKPDGFYGVYPATVVYGVGIAPGLGASGTSGAVYREDGNFDGKTHRVWFGFILERIPMNRNPWKGAYSLRVRQGKEEMFRDDMELQFTAGRAFLGAEGLAVKDGVLTVELAREGRKLFDFDVPIVDGWPTSKAVVKPYPPTWIKTVERDAQGRIAVIREGIG